MTSPPKSQLHGTFRIGRVDSVDADRHTATVRFEEQDGFTLEALQVLVTRPDDYSLPKVGTPVLCLIMEGRLGVGYVIGAIYTEADPAPLSDAGKRAIAGDDIQAGNSNAKIVLNAKEIYLGAESAVDAVLKGTAWTSGPLTSFTTALNVFVAAINTWASGIVSVPIDPTGALTSALIAACGAMIAAIPLFTTGTQQQLSQVVKTK